jgi:hypothetical protein
MSIVLRAIDADKVIKRRFRFSDELDVVPLKCVLLHGASNASKGSTISSFEAVAMSFKDRPLLTPSRYNSGELGELEEVSPFDGSNTRSAVVPKKLFVPGSSKRVENRRQDVQNAEWCRGEPR